MPFVASKINLLDPPFPAPLKAGLRYSLSRKTLGKMERLARAGAETQAVLGGDALPTWTHTLETEQVLVQSVLASGEIEGETIDWEETGTPDITSAPLPLDLAAVTRARNSEGTSPQTSPVLQKRLQAVESITQAAIWAVSLPKRSPLSYDFVLELHRRMFETTLPQVAGKIKEKQNFVEGGTYKVSMLPPAKTEAFLQALVSAPSAI